MNKSGSKIRALVSLLGSKEKAAQIAAYAEQLDRDAEAAGIASKEHAPPVAAKADGDEETANGSQTPTDGEGDEPAEEAYVGDMTLPELVAALLAEPSFAEALAAMTAKSAETVLAPVGEAVTKALADDAAIAEKAAGEKAALLADITKLKAQVAELSGEAPSAGGRGYRASEDPANVTIKGKEAQEALKPQNEWNPLVQAFSLKPGEVKVS
jgi:hypothetical protein